jgi:hypothetical protein
LQGRRKQENCIKDARTQTVKKDPKKRKKANEKMKLTLKDNYLVNTEATPEKVVVCTLFKRLNITGFSDIDFKPFNIVKRVKDISDKQELPNCAIIQNEDGDLVLFTTEEIPANTEFTANFKASRYLKNKKSDKPNMDTRTLDRLTTSNYLNMIK